MDVRRSVTFTCRQPSSGANINEEIRGAVSFVFIIAAHRAPRLHRDRGPRIAEQLPAGFVKTHKGTIRIARTLVNVQHIFHGRTKAASAAGGMTHCLFR